MEELVVVKIGGAILDDQEKLQIFMDQFHRITAKKVLVHGGGRKATDLEKQLGISSQFVEGRRITSHKSLEVAVMAFCGSINKQIVAEIQKRGERGIGISGADASLVTSKKRSVTNNIDFGYVGDPVQSNMDILNIMVDEGLVPVISPITIDENGQLLNTNADTIASVISIGLSGFFDVKLIFCFELSGVMEDIDDENSVISKISRANFKELKDKELISEGMVPKIHNALKTVEEGVKMVKILNYSELECYNDENGTSII